jgi:hypothetical protein
MKRLQAAALLAGLLSCFSWSLTPAQTPAPQPQPPVIFNAPESVRPGDAVGLQGAYFGLAPSVLLQGASAGQDINLPLINSHASGWLSFKIPADAPPALKVTVSNGLAVSKAVSLNGARAHHLDARHIAPAGAFRLFGRSLLVAGFVPTITFDGVLAAVNVAHSNEHMLVATAPPGLRPGSQPKVYVDNGNGSGPALLDRPITVVPGGADPFALGVGWGAGFERIAQRTLVPTGGSTGLCNGKSDDTPAIQAAVDQLAAAGGGVVRLPAGVCRLAGSLKLKSRVVLQGKGKDETLIRYEASYPVWGRNLDLVGVSDLSLQSTRAGIESPLLENSTRAFIKNVGIDLGGGLHMFLTGNTDFVVMDSEIRQGRNPGMHGIYVFAGTGGLVFVNNTTTFAHGAAAFPEVHDAFIANNRFVRDIRGGQTSKDVVHSMTLDFAHHIAVINNHFDLLGGPVTNKLRNDGEAILTEGGAQSRTEGIGRVSSASANQLVDSRLADRRTVFPSGSMPENFAVAIVGGTGAGQSRRVMRQEGATLTVAPNWSVVPDSSSHYVTFVWGLEKALIKGNQFHQNPRGIWLYQTAIRDVDVVDNVFREGGGIYLRSAQNLKDGLFTPMYRVRIANNSIANTTGEWRSYISVMFVRMDEEEFGVGTTGVEVRNNRLVANVPNLTQAQEESGGAEGFINRMHAEGPSQALSKSQNRLLGTVFQNNHCEGCNIGLIVRDGAVATVQDGNTNTTPASPSQP